MTKIEEQIKTIPKPIIPNIRDLKKDSFLF